MLSKQKLTQRAIEEVETTDEVDILPLRDLYSILYLESMGQLPCWHCLVSGEVQCFNVNVVLKAVGEDTCFCWLILSPDYETHVGPLDGRKNPM